MTRFEALARIGHLVKSAETASDIVQYIIKLEIKDLIVEHQFSKKEVLERIETKMK